MATPEDLIFKAAEYHDIYEDVVDRLQLLTTATLFGIHNENKYASLYSLQNQAERFGLSDMPVLDINNSYDFEIEYNSTDKLRAFVRSFNVTIPVSGESLPIYGQVATKITSIFPEEQRSIVKEKPSSREGYVFNGEIIFSVEHRGMARKIIKEVLAAPLLFQSDTMSYSFGKGAKELSKDVKGDPREFEESLGLIIDSYNMFHPERPFERKLNQQFENYPKFFNAPSETQDPVDPIFFDVEE